MTKTWRIGLYVGLAILGGPAVSPAQTAPSAGGESGAAMRPPRSAASTSVVPPPPAMTATRRVNSSYNRLTSASRRDSGSTAPRTPAAMAGYGLGAANDSLKPYSPQSRRSAAGMSTTRVADAPMPPPRMGPASRYDYFPSMRGAQTLNGNIVRRRTRSTPGRGGSLVGGGGGMAGSLGGSSGR